MFKSILKIIIGALLVIGGIYWYFVSFGLGTEHSNWDALLLAIKSVFGILVLFIGIFIVWLESDELKVQREETEQQSQPAMPQEEEPSEAEKIRSAVATENSESSGSQETQDMAVCDICGREFGSTRAMNIHKARSH